MNIKLTKPICFFDLETTGTNITKDKIIEISIFKVFPNGNKESKTWLVNPEMEISKKSYEIHGITNEKVKNEPVFKEIAPKIKEFIKNSDLAGYNSNKFDIPILVEELLRADINLDIKNIKTIDVLNIFYKKEPRTLSAAYKFYCNKNLENAHSAHQDALATYEVLEAQLEKYPDLENNVTFLSEYSCQNKNADLAGFIGFDESNDYIFNFGKYKGQKVLDVFEKDKGYFSWLQNAEFPLYTKKIFIDIKLTQTFKK